MTGPLPCPLIAVRMPTAWWAMWLLLAAGTVALVVLLRTRWRGFKPWHKCALLSLWVHVLLACLAMTVNIVSGNPGTGPETPIRVVVVAASEPLADPPTEPTAVPPDAPSARADSTADDPLEAAQRLETPDAAVSSEAVAEATPVEAASSVPAPAATVAALAAPELLAAALPTAEAFAAETLDAPSPTVETAAAAETLPAPAPVDVATSAAAETAEATVDAGVDASRQLPDPPVAGPSLPNPAGPPDPATTPVADLAKPTQTPSSDFAAAQSSSDAAPAVEEIRSGPPASASESQFHAAARDASALTDVARGADDAAWESAAVHARPRVYARRFDPQRHETVAARGGNAQTERSVRSALAWLAGAQSPDGIWQAARFGAGKELHVLGHDRQGAGAQADTGVSGLALLAFLGAGHTPREGDYASQVERGLHALIQRQRADGALYGDARFFAQMYCHSMASFALCEAYALTGDRRLRTAAERALQFTLTAQNPNDGGWRYQPGDPGDTSQLGWQLMALRSGELAGLRAPDVVWTRVERYLRRVARGAQGGLAAYRPDGPPSRTMTAEAFYCRQLAALHAGAPLDPLAAQEAVASMLRELPGSQRANLYYWYYATLALSGARDRWPAAEPAWRQWNDALVATLLAMQNADGSWPTDTVWGGYGGQVYTTAMGALCLETYYRYDAEAETPRPPANLARRPAPIPYQR